MKRIFLPLSILFVFVPAFLWGEPIWVQCDSNKIFTDNTCDVCYTDTLPTVADVSWWTSQPGLVVPWKHGDSTLSEVIVQSEQTLPSIVVSDGVDYTPTIAESIWEFHTDINWTSLGTNGDQQAYIDAGETKNLYSIKTGSGLTFSGNKSSATVLVRTTINYELTNIAINESLSSEERTICVLNIANAGTVTSTSNTATTTSTSNTTTTNTNSNTNQGSSQNSTNDTASGSQETQNEDLNSAGPEENQATAEQTGTQAGPEVWIFIVLALAFASAWNAWKKSRQA